MRGKTSAVLIVFSTSKTTARRRARVLLHRRQPSRTGADRQQAWLGAHGARCDLPHSPAHPVQLLTNMFATAVIPVTAFILGTWQVQRLKWKSELIAKCEDRIVRPPLPLPARIDHTAIADFDYRRVSAVGRFRHDKEMLIGPRVREGELGYMVVTPLEREGDPGATVLVNRGWISKKLADQSKRPESLPKGEVRVEGMLREPWKKNMFTPDNIPEKGEFYFPDVVQMAALTGSQPVWVEETMGGFPLSLLPSLYTLAVPSPYPLFPYHHLSQQDH